MTLNNKVKNSLLAVLAISVTTGSIYSYQKYGIKQVSAETIETPVATEFVHQTDIIEIVSATGTVSPAEENGIYIATTQKVADVYVKLGDHVSAGDALCSYDVNYSKKELENSLKQQQLNLNNSQLILKNLTSPISESEEIQYENNITTAEKALLDANTNLTLALNKIAQLEDDLLNAEKTVKDNEVLLEIGAITKESYQQSIDAVTVVENSLRDAKANLESLEMAVSTSESSLAQANKNYELAKEPLGTESAQISYEQQKNEISKAQLTIQNVQNQISELTYQSIAHTDGTIIEINVEEGSIVNDDMSIMKIADLNQLIVNANVSEYDAPLLSLGQRVEITTDAIENAVYTGAISYISPVAAITSTYSGNETTVAIEVTIDNPDGILKPGYSVDMEILVTDLKDVLGVSFGAIMKDAKNDVYYVYTVDEKNNLKRADVTIGATDDLLVEIKTGLSEGDQVITSPTMAMEEGTNLSLYTATTSSETREKPSSDSGQGEMNFVMPVGGSGGSSGGGNMGGPMGGRP